MTTPQTPQQIASRVLELHEIATAGPWVVGAGDDYYIHADAYPTFPHYFKEDDLGPSLAIIGNRTKEFGSENAIAIAYYRTAAPELARAVIKAESDLAAMREENERLEDILGIFWHTFPQKEGENCHEQVRRITQEFRDLRGKADGLAAALETIAERNRVWGDQPTVKLASEPAAAYRAAQGVEGDATPPSDSSR